MKVIGVDIGGTSVKGIVIDSSGSIYDQNKADTRAQLGKEHILSKVQSVIGVLMEKHGDIAGIGLGTAGRVDVDTGEIVYATGNLPGWHGAKLKSFFTETYKLPVIIDNDANTALVGEAWLGAASGLQDVTMLTLGTGVGGANMIQGGLYRGAGWNGGEWGHTVLVPGGRACNCGLSGCVEQYLSGTALVSLASEAAGHSYVSGVEVFADFQQGKPRIVEVVQQFIAHLAIVLNNLHIGLNPQAIVIGGGMIHSGSIWWPLLQKQLHSMNLSGIDVRPAKLGNDAGSIGAAKLMLDVLM